MDSGTHGLKCMSCGSVFCPLHPPPLPHLLAGAPQAPCSQSPGCFHPQVCEQQALCLEVPLGACRLRPALSREAEPALTALCLPPLHPHIGASCTCPGSAVRGGAASCHHRPGCTRSRTLPPQACPPQSRFLTALRPAPGTSQSLL